MLVCTSSFLHPTGVCTPGSSSLPGMEHQHQPTSSLRCRFHSHKESLLCCRDSPQSLKFTAPLMSQIPTQKQLWIQLRCCDFPHSKAKSLQVLLMGLSPLGNNTASLPNRFQGRPITPIIKISTSKRHDHINSKNPTVKQARQDIHKHFHSKDSYICFTSKSLSIPNTFLQINIWLHLTKVIQNSITILYLHFLKRYTDDPNPIPPSYQPHLWTPRAYPPEKIHQKAQSHYSHRCLEDPERSSETFLHKWEILHIKDPLY